MQAWFSARFVDHFAKLVLSAVLVNMLHIKDSLLEGWSSYGSGI